METGSAKIWGWLIASLAMPALASEAWAQDTVPFPIFNQQDSETTNDDQDTETSQFLQYLPRQQTEAPQDTDADNSAYGYTYTDYPCLVDDISVYAGSISITCSADMGPLGESVILASAYLIDDNAQDIEEARDMVGHALQLYQIGLQLSEEQRVILRVHLHPIRGQQIYSMRSVSLNMADYRGDE